MCVDWVHAEDRDGHELACRIFELKRPYLLGETSEHRIGRERNVLTPAEREVECDERPHHADDRCKDRGGDCSDDNEHDHTVAPTSGRRCAPPPLTRLLRAAVHQPSSAATVDPPTATRTVNDAIDIPAVGEDKPAKSQSVHIPLSSLAPSLRKVESSSLGR